MAYIKAPFNFVPISPDVFFPSWADQISHDVPFKDGISGCIDLKITAETPIFIRNGHTKKDGEQRNDRFMSFSQTPDGRYFIPGTTIKGAVRNVLEIMSNGKMLLDKRMKFAQREWNNTELYTIKTPAAQSSIHCGWLMMDGDSYFISDRGLPYRISHKDIDAYLGDHRFESHFSAEKHHGKLQDADKTASVKYDLVKGTELSGIHFSEVDEIYSKVIVSPNPNGSICGTIVFTGQPDLWKWPRAGVKGAGKYYEFVFSDREENAYDIPTEDFEHFKFIYESSSEWDRIKKNLKNGGTPVFFRVEGGYVKDFGLAYLYKLPYEKSPYDCLPEDHKVNELDLAECIFGKVGDTKEGTYSLKGRVHFSPAFSENAVQETEEKELVLGSPKASYYPIYIRQNTPGKYSTYNDGELAGWKRYVGRNELMASNIKEDTPKTVVKPFKPVKEGAVFNGKIRFFNLKPVELGALLSALTFHGTESGRYQLGQAKAFGYGKVKFDVTLEDSSLDANALMAEFEKIMSTPDEQTGWPGIKRWSESPQMVELVTMASVPVDDFAEAFKYMKLEMQGPNEFVDAKGGVKGTGPKEALGLFSTIVRKEVAPASILATKNLEGLKTVKELADERKLEEAWTMLDTVSDCPEKADIKMTILDGIRAVIDEIIKSADAKKNAKSWDDAIETYTSVRYKVELIKDNTLLKLILGNIDFCQTEKNKEDNMKNASIEDILVFSSTAALAGRLKKRVASKPLDESEIAAIADKWIVSVTKPAYRKSWTSDKALKEFTKAIGSDAATRLIEAMKSKIE